MVKEQSSPIVALFLIVIKEPVSGTVSVKHLVPSSKVKWEPEGLGSWERINLHSSSKGGVFILQLTHQRLNFLTLFLPPTLPHMRAGSAFT